MNNSTEETAVSDKKTARTSTWSTVMTLLGLACIGQFYIFSLIGVIRGYSIQSSVPYYIFLFAVVPLLFVSIKSEYNPYKASLLSISFSVTLIFFSVISMQQSKFKDLGDDLYEQNKYEACITASQKEIDTWYLRSCQNRWEDSALLNIALSYCQLEEFDQARKTFELITQRYGGYCAERGREALAELDVELKRIADLQALYAKENDPNKKVSYLFDIAIAYRSVYCNGKAKEQYALIQTLDVRESRKEQARKFSEGL